MARSNKRYQKKVVRPPEECYFCTSKSMPSYKKPEELSRFLSPRGKILSKRKNGLCSKHQRRLSKEIKRARYLALLPYIVRP